MLDRIILSAAYRIRGCGQPESGAASARWAWWIFADLPVVISDMASRKEAMLVCIARRYGVSGPPAAEPPAGSTDADVARLVAQGRKIDAIKHYRSLHGTDLKTTKDAVDRMGVR